MRKNKKKHDRWVVTWSNAYDSSITSANEAVLVAFGDLGDALSNFGLDVGANIFKVEDTYTGNVTVISLYDAYLGSNNTINTTVVNVDQSVNISPTINIYHEDN